MLDESTPLKASRLVPSILSQSHTTYLHTPSVYRKPTKAHYRKQTKHHQHHVFRQDLLLPGTFPPSQRHHPTACSHLASKTLHSAYWNARLTCTSQGNPRTTAILAVAKANNLEIEQVHTEPAKGVSDDYRLLNKLGKVPTFQGADGYVLSECVAIAIYRKSAPLEIVGRGGPRCNDEDLFQLQLSLSEDYC